MAQEASGFNLPQMIVRKDYDRRDSKSDVYAARTQGIFQCSDVTQGCATSPMTLAVLLVPCFAYSDI